MLRSANPVRHSMLFPVEEVGRAASILTTGSKIRVDHERDGKGKHFVQT